MKRTSGGKEAAAVNTRWMRSAEQMRCTYTHTHTKRTQHTCMTACAHATSLSTAERHTLRVILHSPVKVC